MTITEFLTARLDEDEAVARAASPGPWSAEDEEVKAVDDITVCDAFALSSPQTRATAEHIARHDPARILAEVASKRAIVEEAGQFGLREGVMSFMALCHLATVYADHPDFQAEWAEWAGRS